MKVLIGCEYSGRVRDAFLRAGHTEELMEKTEWVAKAAEKLKPYLKDNAQEYAEGLYETYDNGVGWTPEDAVDEDMSYWGD